MSEDDTPFDYAVFVAYVRKGPSTEENQKVRMLCADFPELVVQAVEDIPAQDRPSWLTGTPTVVEMATMRVTRGREALRALEDWAASRPKPVSTDPAGHSATGVSLNESFAPVVADGEDGSPVRRFASVEDLLQRRAEGPAGKRQARRPPADV